MVVMGVDPGQAGAIAVVADVLRLAAVTDMPVVPRRYGKGAEVDAGELWDTMRDLAAEHDVDLVAIEEVGAMPKQGVTSSFHFGQSHGVVLGVAAAVGLPVVRVRPQVWKRRAGLIGRPKGASLALARERWPERRQWFARVKDEGRAEAALIAGFGSGGEQ